MIMKTFVFVLCCYVVAVTTKSTAQDSHYWAGVVEFSSQDKWNKKNSPEQQTAINLNKYKEIINSPDARTIDILVFPEETLNSVQTSSFVPSVDEHVVPCNDLKYDPVVRDLSCLARERQMYLVINLVEKAPCPEIDDWRPCASSGLYLFNSNVVFDRTGLVIARYRKFHLFGELEKNTTLTAELVRFDTDFGITFGTFICFDLMFEQPALQLVRSGITDIIFPTMWFSELPFLTAVQIQQAWAYKNNVNLLAAGASYPDIGSTGTGIYAGRRGRLVSVMNHNPEVKLYVAHVPKITNVDAPIDRQPLNKFSPAEMTKLSLKRDQIDAYTTFDLPLMGNSNYSLSVCQNMLCCNFTINYSVTAPAWNQEYYQYKLGVHDAERSFDGFANGHITACAIFACTGQERETCGTRFNASSNVVNAVTFHSIEVSGVFRGGKEVFLLPNNVDTSILPFEVNEIEYLEEDFQKGDELFKTVHCRLVSPRSDLLTFGIWGREFLHGSGDDTGGTSAKVISPMLVLHAIICYFYIAIRR